MAGATTDSVDFEQPDTLGTDIERYISNLENGYKAKGDPDGGSAQRMQLYGVKEIFFCKELTEVGHEYISAKVVGAGSTPAFYIVFERFRGPGDPHKHTESSVEPVNEKQSLKGIVQASSKASSPCLQDGPANDRVSISESPERKKGELKRTVTFKGSIPLYKVAVLANTVHFSEKTYILNSSNCYFYATTVMQVIEKVYGKEIEKSTNSNTSSTMPGTVPFLNRISLPKLYHQTKIDRNTFQRISDRYHSNLETFEAKAQSKDKQFEQMAATTREERDRADKEKRRADEAEDANRALLEELAALKGQDATNRGDA